MEFPALYGAAEQVARESQKKFFAVRAMELSSLVLAGVFAQVPSDIAEWAPAAAFLAFVAALFLRVSGAGDRHEERWYEARAAAESIKSYSWQYAVGGEAYRIDDEEARRRFASSLREIMQALPRLDVPVQSMTDLAVTEEMSSLRSEPLADRISAYVTGRVHDQLKWYRDKAIHNQSRARTWRQALLAVEVAAVVLGLGRAMRFIDFDWLAILAALGAALMAWQQTKNYSFLSESYSVTSHEVGIIADTLGDEVDEESWSQAVHDAEAAFSREHTLWKARRQGPPSP